MINWQLSKQGIRWPVSPERVADSGIDPSRSSILLKFSADKLLVLKWSQAQFVFKCIGNKLRFWAALDLLNFDIKLTSEAIIEPVKAVAFDFSHHGHALVMRWSRSTSNFYALIGQNFTGEFMHKIYAASWNLLTDRWS